MNYLSNVMVLQSKSNVIYVTREWYPATPQMIFASLKLKKKMCMIVIVLMFTVFAQQSLLELFHKRILKEMYGVIDSLFCFAVFLQFLFWLVFKV